MSLRDTYETGFDEDTGAAITNTTCPECSGTLVTEDGETSCLECGLVTDEYRLNHAATPRTADDDAHTRERTGAPLTPARHDRGLNTEIGRGKDGNGNRLSQAKRRTLNRLRTQHSRAQFESKADRNLAHACGEIARLTSTLELSRTRREGASTLYRRAQQKSLIHGRSIESMAAGSVYAACRCSGTVLTVPQIAEVTSCSMDTVWNAYGVLNTKLDLDVPVRRPQAFIATVASDCTTDVPDRVRHRALELTAIAEDAGIANGRNPAGVAAACLYRAGSEAEISLTQTGLAEAASVTPGTIRKRRDELQATLGDA